jgi:hypothetical protein
LVDGITRAQAGEELNLSRQSVGNSVKRVEAAHNLILAGYVPPRPEPAPPSQKGATVRFIPGRITD